MSMTDVGRPALTVPQKVMIGGFAIVALLTLVVVQVLYGRVDPVALVIGLVALASAGGIATGRSWAVVVATVVVSVLLLFDGPIFVERFGRPEEVGWFLVSLLALCCYLAILAGGVRTLVRERRR